MFELDEKLMADNRALIAIYNTESEIEDNLKEGMIIYIKNTATLYTIGKNGSKSKIFALGGDQKYIGNIFVEGIIAGTAVKLIDADGNLVDLKADDGTPIVQYVLPPATKNTLGGIKVGNNLTISSDGTLSSKINTTYISQVEFNIGKNETRTDFEIDNIEYYHALVFYNGRLMPSNSYTFLGTNVSGNIKRCSMIRFRPQLTYGNVSIVFFNQG